MTAKLSAIKAILIEDNVFTPEGAPWNGLTKFVCISGPLKGLSFIATPVSNLSALFHGVFGTVDEYLIVMADGPVAEVLR